MFGAEGFLITQFSIELPLEHVRSGDLNFTILLARRISGGTSILWLWS
jgi:hypothetical protein